MVRTEVIIGVKDVVASSKWYQRLLDCKSQHGGDTFEILADADGQTILNLHKWGEHDHPTLSNPDDKPGNGLILYFRVDSIDKLWENAKRLEANVEEEPHVNENSSQREFSLRDPDGYYVTVST